MATQWFTCRPRIAGILEVVDEDGFAILWEGPGHYAQDYRAARRLGVLKGAQFDQCASVARLREEAYCGYYETLDQMLQAFS